MMRPKAKYCLPIAGIGRTGELRVEVRLADGRWLWLPRSQAEFYPGKVFIPQWLADRLAGHLPGACAPVKAPATAVVPGVGSGSTSCHGE
jgi:hypothetical protein